MIVPATMEGAPSGGMTMPINAHIPSGCFSQDEIDVMVAAFERSLTLLGLKDRNDQAVTKIAKRIIELAQQGETDSGAIAAKILAERQPSGQ